MDDTTTTSISSENLNESPAVDLASKFMIMGVIILFMIIVISLFIHLYAKFCLCIGVETTTLGQEQPTNGALRKGLDPLVLRSLPILVFQSQEFKDGLECAVCLCDVVEGEKTRLLPKCNHGFHVDCIDMWFQSHSTCPLCRDPIGFESCSSNDSESLEGDNSPNFPINVLIYGNQTRVSSIGTLLEASSSATSSSSSTTSTSTSNRDNGMLVIDIPSEINSSIISPSASRVATDDMKSPVSVGRLRSLKRLLSCDRRSSPRSPISPCPIDVEQGGET